MPEKTLLYILKMVIVMQGISLAASDSTVNWYQLLEESKKVLTSKPADIMANFNYSIAMANLGKIDEAYSHIKEISEGINKKDFNQALKPHLQQLEKNPDNLLLLNYAAFGASINKEYRKSIDYFREIINLEPQNIWIRNYLAAIYIELEEYEEAEKELSLAIEIKDNKYSHLLLGIINYRQGNMLKAAIELGKSGDVLQKLIFK